MSRGQECVCCSKQLGGNASRFSLQGERLFASLHNHCGHSLLLQEAGVSDWAVVGVLHPKLDRPVDLRLLRFHPHEALEKVLRDPEHRMRGSGGVAVGHGFWLRPARCCPQLGTNVLIREASSLDIPLSVFHSVPFLSRTGVEQFTIESP